jgi:hypothetical protein
MHCMRCKARKLNSQRFQTHTLTITSPPSSARGLSEDDVEEAVTIEIEVEQRLVEIRGVSAS